MCQWKSLIQRRPTNVNVYLLIIRGFFLYKMLVSKFLISRTQSWFNTQSTFCCENIIKSNKKHFLYRSNVSWFIYFLRTVCFKQCIGRYKMLFLLWYQMKCQYTREFTKIRAFCCRLRITALFNRIVIKQEKRPTYKDIQQRTITGENFLWKYIWL